MARTKRSATSPFGHGFERAITITCATKQSAPVRTGEVPLIWQLFGKTYSDHRCSWRWIDGQAQVAEALTKLHVMETCYELLCRQAFTVFVEAPKSWLPDVKKVENVKEYRESSHH